MSSLLTNESSMVALSTLRSINKNLAQIQNEISTGKKVSSARDNAAFWAVSTVMQSDVDGFTAIQKSLSLGSGTVGVARDAAEQITELLKQIKAIVVAAQEENVDRAKMQTDIQQLRDQIETIVNAAQFNGLNLLKSAAPAGGDAEPATVTITTTGDLSDVSDLENEELTINGETFTFTNDADQTQAVVDFLNGLEGVSAEVDDDGNIVITSTVALEISFSDDAVGTALGLDAGTFEPEAAAGGGGAASNTVNFLAALNRDANGNVTSASISVSRFDLSTALGGGLAALNLINVTGAAGGGDAEPATVTITTTGDLSDVSDLENEELTINGETFTFTNDADQTQAVVDFLNGLEGVSAEVDDDGNIVITSTVALEISFSDDAVGTALGLDAGTFEPEAAAGGGGAAVDNLQTIEDLIQIAIDAAAAFGSAQKRIDIQGEFVRSIIDAMKLGIGALTDADMEEASARLQSLQVQQQLGIQALAIANQAPQALLMLFR